MNKLQFGVVVALLLALVGIEAFPLLSPQRAAPSWEYRIEGIEDRELLVQLHNLGYGGWEVVSARRAIDGSGPAKYEIIFRRPL